MSFRFLTAGESHGKALVGILEGVPAGLEINIEEIHAQLKRRKLGYGRGARQQIETDELEILSGIRFGKTLGSPICIMIENKDAQAWKDTMQIERRDSPQNPPRGSRREIDVPRPGHADLIGSLKYQHSDIRNVLERASARETAIRVALGSVARKVLEVLGVEVASRVTRIGPVTDGTLIESISLLKLNEKVDLSPVRCLCPEAAEKMIFEIERAKKDGDTLGGEFEVLATGLPLGLGSYVHWDRRIEGEIAQTMMSLNAIKGVEIGLGFRSASMRGSQVHDEIVPSSGPLKCKVPTNRSGGIDGGMTNGNDLVVRVAKKPLSTLMSPLSSVNLSTGESQLAHIERSDVCAVPAAAVIGESLLSLVLVKSLLEKFGGDSMNELRSRVVGWRENNSLG